MMSDRSSRALLPMPVRSSICAGSVMSISPEAVAPLCPTLIAGQHGGDGVASIPHIARLACPLTITRERVTFLPVFPRRIPVRIARRAFARHTRRHRFGTALGFAAFVAVLHHD